MNFSFGAFLLLYLLVFLETRNNKHYDSIQLKTEKFFNLICILIYYKEYIIFLLE